MKNKKVLAVLIILAVVQLIFPLGFFMYEGIAENAIIEKGKSYTLKYSTMPHLTKESLAVDCDEIYTVGYNLDYEDRKFDFVPYNIVGNYVIVGINETENGEIEFFDIEDENVEVELTDYNWFETYEVFSLKLDEYEFVKADFGMKELYEIGMYLSEDATNDSSFEEFMQSEDGYYNGIWSIPLEGKVTLCVYNGRAKISELYIGEDVVLKYKQQLR